MRGNSHKRVLIIVQNLPVPFDRRVWQEARTLATNGYKVSVICPKGRDYDASYECLEGIHIYRHPLPLEAKGALGYALEYGSSLFWEFALACRVFCAQGFDVIHACNPPDTIFLIGGFFKIFFGKKFLFDHHDINPELYEAKFKKRGFFYRLLLVLERLTFATADISIATNDSYRSIAIERGKMKPEKVFVVRSGPSLERLKIVPPQPGLKNGRHFLVGYVGVIGKQEGLHYLIEAARYIIWNCARNDIHFIIAGDGTALEEIKKLAAEKHVLGFITFAGRVSEHSLLEILSTADICVNPDEVNALNDKSTMNKIMEYMALGKPIVQFDMTEGRISAAHASLYATPNDARDFAEKILWLLDNPAERAQMGKFGRNRIEKELAWPYEAPKLLAAYEALFAIKYWDDAFAEKALWYWYRLRAMSSAEILFRIQEFFKRKIDRFRSFTYQSRDYGILPSLPDLQEGLRNWHVPKALLADWQQQYEEARTGRFVLLGQYWPECAASEKWHLDPIKNKAWPKKYAFSLNYRNTPDYGDVKYVWELNRLQYLQPIAALAFIQKDVAIAEFCWSEMESWIDNNPPYKGINWTSGIEIALRIISMVVITTLVGEHAKPEQQLKIWGSIEAHTRWLERYPSRFSSGNNHQVAEALALFLIGELCSQLPRAEHLKESGWKMLCGAAVTQILPDGTGAEQAIAYTGFVAEMLLLGWKVARTRNIDIPQEYTSRLALAGEYLRWLTDKNGNQPKIGDDDNACVLGSYRQNDSYAASILASISAALQRPDLAPPHSQPHLRQAFFGFTQPSSLTPTGMRIFSHGGMTVGRHNIHEHEILLALDHGPLGYLSIAAHGHADAASLWLHIDGEPILVDAGTCIYHADQNLRDHFHSTKAHNTLCIENADSSIMAGNFNWSHKANTKLIAYASDKDQWHIEMEHDGYQKQFDVLHRRRLDVNITGFCVKDWITGDAPQSTEINYLLHPSLSAIQCDNVIEIRKGDKLLLQLSAAGSLKAQLLSGWYSPSFGKKESTTRITFSGILIPGQKFFTRFAWKALMHSALLKTAEMVYA